MSERWGWVGLEAVLTVGFGVEAGMRVGLWLG